MFSYKNVSINHDKNTNAIHDAIQVTVESYNKNWKIDEKFSLNLIAARLTSCTKKNNLVKLSIYNLLALIKIQLTSYNNHAFHNRQAKQNKQTVSQANLLALLQIRLTPYNNHTFHNRQATVSQASIHNLLALLKIQVTAYNNQLTQPTNKTVSQAFDLQLTRADKDSTYVLQ